MIVFTSTIRNGYSCPLKIIPSEKFIFEPRKGRNTSDGEW
jgi:hypothetical protein